MADSQRFDVDGEIFEVSPHPSLPNRYQFAWVSGRNPGYGFTVGVSEGRDMTQEQMVDRIRFFLAQIDPETGYMAD